MEHLRSLLSGIAIPLLLIILGYLRNIKKEFREYVDKICSDNKEEHKEIWERVNHHQHNGNGRVVIPD